MSTKRNKTLSSNRKAPEGGKYTARVRFHTNSTKTAVELGEFMIRRA